MFPLDTWNLKVKSFEEKSFTPFLTRPGYDNCALELRDRESADPNRWQMDPSVKESQQRCFVQHSPFQQTPFYSLPSTRVDIESELFGNNQLLTMCPEKRYSPMAFCKDCEKCNSGMPCGCAHCASRIHQQVECEPKYLEKNYTREKRSCNVLSGVNINRFNPLCDDLQDLNKIPSNAAFGSDTRFLYKDAYDKSNLKTRKFNYR